MNKVKIKYFHEAPIYKKIFKKDKNDREINLYKFSNYSITGENLFYPNPVMLSKDKKIVYKPIREETMSLKKAFKQEEVFYIRNNLKIKKVEKDPVFFFIYNTDNYFHFIYDTLPYLISYLFLKKRNNKIKLLMNFPNKNKKEFYTFICEFLELLGIKKKDIKIVNEETLYRTIYVSNSYTHDFDSNKPPRNEIYKLYTQIVKKAISKKGKNYPSKIYVSRRSWIHGDVSNIGTNYTNRRKMQNEDQLIAFLEKKGYKEVFPERMSSIEKINLFYNAREIVGAIGGGMCNCLFSKKDCKVITIVSPCFLEINKRFEYSLNKCDLTLFSETKHTEKTEIKSNMRVKYKKIIGEVVNINKNKVTINYSKAPVSGWNSEEKYNQVTVNTEECKKIDNGLNSPWKINIKKFKNIIK